MEMNKMVERTPRYIVSKSTAKNSAARPWMVVDASRVVVVKFCVTEEEARAEAARREANRSPASVS